MVMVQDMIQAHLAHLNLVCPLTFWCYNLNILINHYSAKASGSSSQTICMAVGYN